MILSFQRSHTNSQKMAELEPSQCQQCGEEVSTGFGLEPPGGQSCGVSTPPGASIKSLTPKPSFPHA